METILSFITSTFLAIGGFLGLYDPEPQTPVYQPEVVVVEEAPVVEEETFGATRPAGLFPYFLGGGGISSSDTSITLTT